MRFRRGSSTGAGSLDFTTGGTERLRITPTGLVGITESPTVRLEIVESNVKTWTPTSQTELLVERNGNCIVSIVGRNDSNCQLNLHTMMMKMQVILIMTMQITAWHLELMHLKDFV